MFPGLSLATPPPGTDIGISATNASAKDASSRMKFSD